ncbi:MAG TPA: hypothetical protein VK508_21730 [Cyclobacteriaceae bacterium]|nr:hypothetical protein [Cyclobacteriaceae bacterium]
MTWSEQLFWLLILPLPIACIAWTITHEEIFREAHEYCVARSERASRVMVRKFFYALSCEYCFSHYVTILFLILTDYKLLMTNWVGYVIAGFAVVWIANIYMSLYGFLRTDLKKEKIQANIEEKEFEEMK